MPILKLPDANIHYETAGDSGPCVLMIQGVGVAGSGWKPQQNFLAKHCRTVSFDNRNIGQSKELTQQKKMLGATLANDAIALAQHLGWSNVHVVGHSMGGVLSQQVAASKPQAVKSLTLMSTFADGSNIGKISSARMLWLSIRSLMGTKRMRRHAFLRNAFPAEWLEGKDLDQLHEKMATIFGRDLGTTPPVVMKQISCCKGLRPYETVAAHKIPTLILHGEQDNIAPISGGCQLQEVYPHAKAVFVAEAGHALPLQCEDFCNELLLEHILKHD